MSDAERATLLRIEELSVSFPHGKAWTTVVEDVSFSMRTNEVLGLVGESGSGKTLTALAIAGLARMKGARVDATAIEFGGVDLLRLPPKRAAQVRGRDIGMIFQQPTRSLNPAFTVGDQIAEVARRHLGMSRKDAWRRAVSMLDRVRIPRAEQRARDYPHMLSGGMCQRVMIAMAIMCDPKLLIADEPTTALDVTVQARVLELLQELRDDLGMAVLLITHDLGVVAQFCERVAVMYAGQLVELSPTLDLLEAPVHPYTRGLISAVPRVGASERLVAIPGVVPPPWHLPSGCRFHPRCRAAMEGVCDVTPPLLTSLTAERDARCLLADQFVAEGRRT